jgi:hypothetical protein
MLILAKSGGIIRNPPGSSVALRQPGLAAGLR